MAGSQPAPRQPVSENRTAVHEPVLRRPSEQPSREDLMFDQIWKLNVRLPTGMSDFRVHRLPGDTSTLLDHPWNHIRYDTILLTERPPG